MAVLEPEPGSPGASARVGEHGLPGSGALPDPQMDAARRRGISTLLSLQTV